MINYLNVAGVNHPVQSKILILLLLRIAYPYINKYAKPYKIGDASLQIKNYYHGFNLVLIFPCLVHQNHFVRPKSSLIKTNCNIGTMF